MIDYLRRLLYAEGLPPHGYCLLWEPSLVWTHVVADLLIGLSYFAIPIVLATFLTRRGDVRFGWVVWMFAAFIMACGTTHFFSIVTLWQPLYGAEALVKLLTAAVSVFTAIALWPLLPKAVALPSPAQLPLAKGQLVDRIRERDQALARLEQEMAERSRVEAMLRQAQKMEAVGQLTSGVAHDFNNLLTIITANVERAERLAAADPRLARPLMQAAEGAQRAAKLTHQLLAFSRRQPLQATVANLNALVRDFADMLERTLGPTIEVVLDLDESVPQVRVDASQTGNAILNLAINARDAMPEGGFLTIATRAAGGGVALTVCDTGCGMSDAVREHAIEPFFTTKDLGKGSGLGLSQVYGFAKQSGGDITIDSEPGRGTSITIILPEAAGAAADGR